MNFSEKPAAARVWFDADNLWLELTDGRRLAVPLAYFPRLQRATPRQRLKFEMSGGGTGLHWEALDEDISVAGLLAGRGDQTRTSGNGKRPNKNSRRSVRKSVKADPEFGRQMKAAAKGMRKYRRALRALAK